MSGRWQSVEDLARISGNASIAAVREALHELRQEYGAREGGIVMSETGGRYRLEINPDVRDKVYYLAPEPELSPALIKTLALIAYKQPIYQSGVVRVIGNRAYEYIRELRKKEFISIKKKGRTKLISTTGRFNKYFGLEGQFKPDLGSKALEEAQKKLDEVIRDAELEDVEEEIKGAIESMQECAKASESEFKDAEPEKERTEEDSV